VIELRVFRRFKVLIDGVEIPLSDIQQQVVAYLTVWHCDVGGILDRMTLANELRVTQNKISKELTLLRKSFGPGHDLFAIIPEPHTRDFRLKSRDDIFIDLCAFRRELGRAPVCSQSEAMEAFLKACHLYKDLPFAAWNTVPHWAARVRNDCSERFWSRWRELQHALEFFAFSLRAHNFIEPVARGLLSPEPRFRLRIEDFDKKVLKPLFQAKRAALITQLLQRVETAAAGGLPSPIARKIAQIRTDLLSLAPPPSDFYSSTIDLIRRDAAVSQTVDSLADRQVCVLLGPQ